MVLPALTLHTDEKVRVGQIELGEETSVVQLYQAISSVTGVERDPEHVEPRLGELQRSVLDPSLAGRELGWRPETSLERGLRKTWEWLQQQD